MPCAGDGEPSLPASFPPILRNRDLELAGQVLAGDGLGLIADGLRGAFDHDVPAENSRAGTEINDMVRGPHGLLIVFHHDYRVAAVAEFLQRVEQTPIVTGVQPDAGLVEDVGDAYQAGADLAGHADTLRFATGEGRRLSVES